MKCGACQRECRSRKIAYVPDGAGTLRRARVCVSCFDDALHIVPTQKLLLPKSEDETKARRRESKEVVSAAIRKLRDMAKAYDQRGEEDPQNGYFSHAFETAANVLAAGDF